MTSISDRQRVMTLIDEATINGARQAQACKELDISNRTLQRWRLQPEDRRPQAVRPVPANKLSKQEREVILETVNNAENASLPPHQIVPKLADQGIYLASESTMYRILKENGQQHDRGRSKRRQSAALTSYCATAPNQIWCWDITWLPSAVRGQFYYWYMMKDVDSRKLVGNEVHEMESSELASGLLQKACLRENLAGSPLVLHSDNGSAMKGATMLATMQNLGVMPSFSRPRVSNDNAYAESLFRTAKYCPMWPSKPFASLDEAREWVRQFTAWYNEGHRHSAINFVTPGQRHRGEAESILAKRKTVYQSARARHPLRWSGEIRNWDNPQEVWLNPEREINVATDRKSEAA